MLKRQEIIKLCNVMVDGRFVDELKDMNLKFRGSSNQRVINLQESLKRGNVVLWED
jgi:anaerobic ribonucleoside-triphosphate reductase activating protein